MTPEDHYREAERLIELDGDAGTRREAIDKAQVHATLATARGPMTDEEIAKASARGSRTLGRRQ